MIGCNTDFLSPTTSLFMLPNKPHKNWPYNHLMALATFKCDKTGTDHEHYSSLHQQEHDKGVLSLLKTKHQQHICQVNMHNSFVK